MNKLLNAIRMVHILSLRNVVSVKELSSLLDMNERSVGRLKDMLIDAGFHIQTIMGPHGGYLLESRSNVFNLDFNHDEMKLIRQGLQYLVQSDGINPSPEFPLAIAKLANEIDGFGIDTISSFQSVQLNVDKDKYQKHIQQLETAILNHQRVQIEYQKNHKEMNSYEFDPYEMIIVDRFWYLMGFDERRRYLSLKISRMQDVTLIEKTFLKDESLMEQSVNRHGYRIKPVTLECIITNGDYLSEYIWGKNQRITWFEDGSFKLEVEFQNEGAAKDFILRNGSKVKLLQPVEMVHWLQEELKKILSHYP